MQICRILWWSNGVIEQASWWRAVCESTNTGRHVLTRAILTGSFVTAEAAFDSLGGISVVRSERSYQT